MRTKNLYVMAMMAMLMLVSSSALAQQAARRNSSVKAREDAAASASADKSSARSASVSVSAASASGSVSGSAGRNTGGSLGTSRDDSRGYSSSSSSSSGKGSGYGSGSHGDGGKGHGGYGHGGHGDYGARPRMPYYYDYDRSGIIIRSNASSIVVRTVFRSKAEAYRYVESLLLDNSYSIGTFGNGYSWLQSEVTYIPTPFDWSNPLAFNQFRIKANFYDSFGRVNVVLSADWRESVFSNRYSAIRFSSNRSYSTYYAWCVLEDLASSIPHDTLAYR